MRRSRAAEAAKAFVETLEGLGLPEDTADFSDPATLGRRAALLVVSEAIWGKYLGPLLETEDVQTLLRVNSRQAVSDLAKRGRLLALNASGGRKVYPAFQFARGGRPFPEMADVMKIFSGAVETPYTIASWMVTSEPLLDGKTPAAWMQDGGDPEPLFEAARRMAWRLDQ